MQCQQTLDVGAVAIVPEKQDLPLLRKCDRIVDARRDAVTRQDRDQTFQLTGAAKDGCVDVDGLPRHTCSDDGHPTDDHRRSAGLGQRRGHSAES